MALKAEEMAKILGAEGNLPIICMVDGELCADDSCRRWAGCVGSVEIKEYITIDQDDFWLTGGQAIFWKEDADELVDLMCERFDDDLYEQKRKEAQEKVDAYEWIRAVVLYVDIPEE